MRKICKVIVIVAALSLGLACGAFCQEPKFKGITLSVVHHAGHKQFDPVWEKLGEFEKQTGIKVKLILMPYGELLGKQLRELQLGRKELDVLDISEAHCALLAPLVAPIEDFLRKDGTDIAAWKAQLPQVALDYGTYEDKVVLYPYYCGTQMGAYRKNLFEDPEERAAFRKQYGYELGPPRTFKELLDIGKFFTRDIDGDGKTDLWGWVVPGKWDQGGCRFERNLFGEGLRYFDENFHCMWGPKHPENQKIVENLARWDQDVTYKWKVVSPEILGLELGETIDFYLEGKAAMVMTWIYVGWDKMKAEATIERIGPSVSFAPPLRRPDLGKGGFASVWIRGISKHSTKKEAAWEFVKWFCSDENTKLACTKGTGAFIPAKISLAEWAGKQGLIPEASAETLKRAQAWRPNPMLEQCRNVLREYHEKLLQNVITPEEFVKETGEKIEQIVVEAGVTKD